MERAGPLTTETQRRFATIVIVAPRNTSGFYRIPSFSITVDRKSLGNREISVIQCK